jgi:NAD+ kinase
MIKVIHKFDPQSTSLAAHISSRLPNHTDDLLLVIAVGGDGTILRAIHEHMDHLDTTIFFGVRSGHLGFFTDYTEASIDQLVEAILKKSYSVTTFDLLEACVTHNGQDSHFMCLNEFQLISGVRTITLDLNLDGKRFETFRGNGLVFSTPAGSTGLNKSLGGAIIDPTLAGVQITEVAPINSNAYRTIGSPMVVNVRRHIEVTTDPTDLEFSYDHVQIHLHDFTKLELLPTPKKVQIAQIEDVNFFERVKKAFL